MSDEHTQTSIPGADPSGRPQAPGLTNDVTPHTTRGEYESPTTEPSATLCLVLVVLRRLTRTLVTRATTPRRHDGRRSSSRGLIFTARGVWGDVIGQAGRLRAPARACASGGGLWVCSSDMCAFSLARVC